jgi:hypothetical protein
LYVTLLGTSEISLVVSKIAMKRNILFDVMALCLL